MCSARFELGLVNLLISSKRFPMLSGVSLVQEVPLSTKLRLVSREETEYGLPPMQARVEI
jgi:hypothetical protein